MLLLFSGSSAFVKYISNHNYGFLVLKDFRNLVFVQIRTQAFFLSFIMLTVWICSFAAIWFSNVIILSVYKQSVIPCMLCCCQEPGDDGREDWQHVTAPRHPGDGTPAPGARPRWPHTRQGQSAERRQQPEKHHERLEEDSLNCIYLGLNIN